MKPEDLKKALITILLMICIYIRGISIRKKSIINNNLKTYKK